MHVDDHALSQEEADALKQTYQEIFRIAAASKASSSSEVMQLIEIFPGNATSSNSVQPLVQNEALDAPLPVALDEDLAIFPQRVYSPVYSLESDSEP